MQHLIHPQWIIFLIVYPDMLEIKILIVNFEQIDRSFVLILEVFHNLFEKNRTISGNFSK
jgi:hypothetical protein